MMPATLWSVSPCRIRRTRRVRDGEEEDEEEAPSLPGVEVGGVIVMTRARRGEGEKR